MILLLVFVFLFFTIFLFIENIRLRRIINELSEKNKNYNIEKENILTDISRKDAILEEKEKYIKEKDNKIDSLEKKVEYFLKIEANNEILLNKNKEQEEYLNKLKNDLILNFKNISADVIKEQKDTFKKEQDDIFKPFKDNIKTLMEKVDENNKINNSNKISFDEQIKILVNKSEVLSKEANDLANALKGNKKLQGNWGEIQLEQILNMSGLEENIDYVKQVTINIDDKVYRPDYIINLPNNRKVIIDSKVSLNNYIEYIKSENPEDKEKYLKNYINDINKHITELSGKEYNKLVKNAFSLDYVFMFLPIEHAYIEAVSKSSDIYEMSFKKKVAIVTPSSLFPILRTIENLWNIEKQNKNVENIIEIGEDIYNQISSINDDLKTLRKSIVNSIQTYSSIYRRFYEGNKNIRKLAEELMSYGIKANKKIEKDAENIDIIDYVNNNDVKLIKNGEKNE